MHLAQRFGCWGFGVIKNFNLVFTKSDENAKKIIIDQTHIAIRKYIQYTKYNTKRMLIIEVNYVNIRVL